MMAARTLIIYSGPTSTDRTQDKNGMYIDNMDFFLQNGVDCGPSSNVGDVNKITMTQQDLVDVRYVFVLTQEVADYYLAPGGKIAQKRSQCSKNRGVSSEEEFIKVIVRQDRCYDMESMRIVLESEEMDVKNSYDNLLFVNCGLIGPKCK